MIGPTNALTVTGTIDPGSVTVGSNLKPVKLVNGVATAVDNDLVSTLGNQTIGGIKTFSKPIYNTENNGEGLELRRSDWSVSATPSADTTKQVIFRGATNNVWDSNPVASIVARRTSSGNSCIRLETRNYWNSSIHNAGLEVWAQNVNGSESHFVAVPTRTYSASNTNDVVTIGSLQASTDVVHTAGNETISGGKTFKSSITGYVTGKYLGECGPNGSSFGNIYLMATINSLPNNEGGVFHIIGGLNNPNYVYATYRAYNGSGTLKIQCIQKSYTSASQKPKLYLYDNNGTIEIYGTSLTWCVPHLFFDYWENGGLFYINLSRHTMTASTDFSTVTLPAGAIAETGLLTEM